MLAVPWLVCRETTANFAVRLGASGDVIYCINVVGFFQQLVM